MSIALQFRPVHLAGIRTKIHAIPFEVAVKRRRVQVVPHIHGGDGNVRTLTPSIGTPVISSRTRTPNFAVSENAHPDTMNPTMHVIKLSLISHLHYFAASRFVSLGVGINNSFILRFISDCLSQLPCHRFWGQDPTIARKIKGLTVSAPNSSF